MIIDVSNCNDRIDGKFFRSLQGNSIIYSHVSNLPKLDHNQDYSDKTIIIRDGDIPTGYEIFQKYNFKRVFCQNLNSPENEKIRCIPIGMESSEYTSKNGWDKFDVIKRIRLLDIKIENLLYANFSINTNMRKRIDCLNYFKDKEFVSNDVTFSLKHPSVLCEKEYEDFCIKVMKHKFVLCPEGNGIDTHRLWETLYLGRIPVVLHNHVNDSFKDLPILILDKWEDFETSYEQFILDRINTLDYSLEKLSFDYWRKMINQNMT